MEFSSSAQWSTGCESRWTVYLDESYISRNDDVYAHPQSSRVMYSSFNDDEDQSMVSDASSGPPHFLEQDDEQQCYNRISSRNNNINNNCYLAVSEESVKRRAKKSKKKEKKQVGYNEHHQQNQEFYGLSSSNHHLDDTASSPTITHSKMCANSTTMAGYSENMSSTHFQGNSSYSNHYAFRQSNHLNETDHSTQLSQLRGRGWE